MHYGYIDFLPNRTPTHDHSNETSVQQVYSLHAGLVAAMATVFGFQDVHCENLIISRLLLHIIDLENVFMPSPPHPFTTALFSETVGGFYGMGKENSAHRLFDVKDKLLPILDPEFIQGVDRFFEMLLVVNYEKIVRWLNHPIMQVTAVRIVPHATQWFKQEKDVMVWYRCREGHTPDDVLLQQFQNTPEYHYDEQQVVRIIHNEPEAITDEGLSALITCGDHNLKTVFNCLCEGDIPAYRMFVGARHLLDPNYQTLRVLDSSQPVNYFLHSPLQAMQDRMMMREHAFYRDFLRRFIMLHFQCLNAQERKSFSTALSVFEEIHAVLYRLLDYATVLKSLGEQNTAPLVELARQLVEASNAINDEYKALVEEAKRLLEPYVEKYERHILSVNLMENDSLSSKNQIKYPHV